MDQAANNLAVFYSVWMDKAEQHAQAANVMYDSEKYDQAIVLYKQSISAYKRAIKFTPYDDDKIEINTICNQITNKLNDITSLQNADNDVDDDDDDDDDDNIDLKQNTETISIQIASDLHLEFDGVYNKMPKLHNIKNTADILVLLGDICYPSLDIYNTFIDSMSFQYKYILIIAGNHEYYSNEIYSINRKLYQIASSYSNVFFLNKNRIELPDISSSIRFIGCTLWVNYPNKLQFDAQCAVNDFHQIKINDFDLNNDIKLNKSKSNNIIISNLNDDNATNLDQNQTKTDLNSANKDNNGNLDQNQTNLDQTQTDLNSANNDNNGNMDQTQLQLQLENDAEQDMLDELMGFDDSDDDNDDKNDKNYDPNNEYKWGQSWKKYIKPNSRQLNVDDINLIYNNHLNWIKSEIISAKKDKKKLIILTHHAPTSYKCISLSDQLLDISFVMNFSSLEYLFKYPVIGWFFGHTHKNNDFNVISDKKWNTRIGSNQLGYYDKDKLKFECSDYSNSKIITFPFDKDVNKNTIECIEIDKLKKQLQTNNKPYKRLQQLMNLSVC